ncbi:MAG: hypothetical protein GY940_08020, partial [bacterium]|nr:hypothetical protein [bacterium]
MTHSSSTPQGNRNQGDRLSFEPLFREINRVVNAVSWTDFDAWQKKDSTYVTTLDIKLQKSIVEIIRKHYPAHHRPPHRILYEEGDQEDTGGSNPGDGANGANGANGTDIYTWIIDPIDGTHNMMQGKDAFATSVGVMC